MSDRQLGTLSGPMCTADSESQKQAHLHSLWIITYSLCTYSFFFVKQNELTHGMTSFIKSYYMYIQAPFLHSVYETHLLLPYVIALMWRIFTCHIDIIFVMVRANFEQIHTNLSLTISLIWCQSNFYCNEIFYCWDRSTLTALSVSLVHTPGMSALRSLYLPAEHTYSFLQATLELPVLAVQVL